MIPAVTVPKFPAMTGDDLEMVRQIEREMLAMPQIPIRTSHVFHAGLYARTIRVPAGVVLSGALIKRATLLVVSGHASVFIGEDTIELCGYHIVPASAGRKQVFLAHADTDLTMIFPSSASTVAEAEEEFTDEADSLMSRHQDGEDEIIITGE